MHRLKACQNNLQSTLESFDRNRTDNYLQLSRLTEKINELKLENSRLQMERKNSLASKSLTMNGKPSAELISDKIDVVQMDRNQNYDLIFSVK